MTTAIYFFLMSVTFFIVPQIVVKYIIKEDKFNPNILYLAFAFILPLIWLFVPLEILRIREVNFLQHAVGGGVAVGFVTIYFIKSLGDKFPILKYFPVQIVFLYALVSMLGVGNEILEFILDTFKIGIFSSDRYDTWYDLVANTSGAFSIFIFWKIVHRLSRKQL